MVERAVAALAPLARALVRTDHLQPRRRDIEGWVHQSFRSVCFTIVACSPETSTGTFCSL